MIKLSVIIPVFNEEENIEFLVNELNIYFGTHKNFSAEIIFVNDGSSDRSLVKLKNARHSFYNFRIVSFSKNFGSHAAVRAGILNAQGDYITFMYADLQDPLSLINRMHEEIIKSEADIVWAWRASVQSGKKEKLFSQMYAYLMRKYAVGNFPEKGFDVVMFTKKVRTLLNKNIENNSSIFIQILNLGFKQSGITYNKQERQAGNSKWTLSKKIKLLIDSFVSFSFAPIRLVSMVGICFFIVGIAWSLYIVARKLIYNDLASGWPALISILTVGFGITNISLGILAEYLWRTLDASRNRPVFVVDEIFEGLQNEDHLETENYYQLNEGL
ncbi:glycosyltransferase [Danxiaibacter flavus]|uniref:Glycosyltransferase n=1 Tax=Danxiaibacter flavus TaxID=3049108 RepID=A0ABV3ZK81_9BACT|nr:glycosyltransferase [Chitinophagaceae bacterium DXS]